MGRRSEAVDPKRVLYTLTLCTGLALFGDSTMYAVLPSRYLAAGVSIVQVGWLLAINRLVRIPLNSLASWLTNRWGAKRPYVAAMLVATISTAGCGLFRGFAPLLFFRALWGVAWALLIVAGYTMVLQVSTTELRGRYVGFFESYAFFGGAVGALAGGLLADALGFRPAFLALGVCTSAALLLSGTLPDVLVPEELVPARQRGKWRERVQSRVGALMGTDARLLLILGLVLTHRFLFAGVFASTLGLHLRTELGEGVVLAGVAVGVASLTAALLFLRNLLTIVIVPLAGLASDALRDRSVVLMVAEATGAVGFVVLSRGAQLPWMVLAVSLVASAYFMVPTMLVSWIGDLSDGARRANVLGAYQTAGDVGSGVAPVVAYALVVALGLRTLYILAALLLAGSIVVVGWMRRSRGVGNGDR